MSTPKPQIELSSGEFNYLKRRLCEITTLITTTERFLDERVNRARNLNAITEKPSGKNLSTDTAQR